MLPDSPHCHFAYREDLPIAACEEGVRRIVLRDRFEAVFVSLIADCVLKPRFPDRRPLPYGAPDGTNSAPRLRM
jgi:hypothetical protein